MIIRFFAAVVIVGSLNGLALAQSICPPQIRWQYSFGSSDYDRAKHIVETADGGFVVAGYSPNTPGAPQYGKADFYLLKLSAGGEKLWVKTYGESSDDILAALEQTADGGFVLGGVSYSLVRSNQTTFWSSDFWVVRTDSDGNKIWDQVFGGADNDWLAALKQTSDGGFILGGTSLSEPGPDKSSPRFGESDYWIVRTDTNGAKLWDASFGGSGSDQLMSIEQTADGGFLLGGRSMSDISGSKTAPRQGGYFDYWLVRVDANGNQLWDRTYGGTGWDELHSVLVAPNGDIILAGTSASFPSGNKTIMGFGGPDFWVLRLDAQGDILWQRAYGGTSSEELSSATVAGNDEFLLTGISYSPPGGSRTSRQYRYGDYWVVKIDGSGNQIWDASFGSMDNDTARSAIPTTDGGYIIVGEAGPGALRTAPHAGYYDAWIIKLHSENAADCDNDGVPNAVDLCADTPFGALVNSSGCTLEQSCPCDDWLDHADYVACVDRTSAEFESAGLITSAQRAALLDQAQDAHCPRSFVAFGLVHVPIKDTQVSGEGYWPTFTPGLNDVFGTTILLGEAESGVFIGPDAGNWGYGDPAWFLEGKAYGRLRGGSNSLIATVRATKPDVEIYPVEIDFAPLNPTSLTLQFFTNGALMKEETVDGSFGTFTVTTALHLHPSVNPFCRLADGSVGALFEFYHEPVEEGWRVYPYDRVFVRANAPAQQVDFVSRVEAVGGGGFESFSFNGEQLGIFGNRHQMLGAGIFQAAGGQLTVTDVYDYVGTAIQFDKTARFEADFLPIDIATNQTSLTLAASHGGSLNIANGLNELVVSAGSWSPGSGTVPSFGAAVEVRAFRNGLPSGGCSVGANHATIGHLVIGDRPAPRIINCVATASSNAPPTIGFSVDRLASFVCTNGSEISGTHFQVTWLGLEFLPEDVSILDVAAYQLPAFTIIGERSQSARPPLSIAANASSVTLAWPDNTRLFRLESSPSLPDGFTTVPAEPDFINNQNQVTLPRDLTGSRFFRLRSGPD